jgi:hypothetical protein
MSIRSGTMSRWGLGWMGVIRRRTFLFYSFLLVAMAGCLRGVRGFDGPPCFIFLVVRNVI